MKRGLAILLVFSVLFLAGCNDSQIYQSQPKTSTIQEKTSTTSVIPTNTGGYSFFMDDNLRIVDVTMFSNSELMFMFYGKQQRASLKSLDFEHNTVTLYSTWTSPQILSLDVPSKTDVDIDNKNDLSITLTSIDQNKASATMKFENLKLISSTTIKPSDFSRIEDNNRVAAIPMNKDTIVTFLFYGDSYSVELVGFDFDHNRITVEMHPQLGTDIVNLNAATNWDLDLDGEDDLALTLISLDPNEGSNVNGEKGTAVIRLESLTPIPEEPTTVTTI